MNTNQCPAPRSFKVKQPTLKKEPNQTGSQRRLPVWNSSPCCTSPLPSVKNEPLPYLLSSHHCPHRPTHCCRPVSSGTFSRASVCLSILLSDQSDCDEAAGNILHLRAWTACQWAPGIPEVKIRFNILCSQHFGGLATSCL